MNSSPSILHVTPTYVDLDAESGGVSNVVRQITRRLAERGWTIHVLCGTRELWEQKGTPGTYRQGRVIRHVLEHNGAPWWAPFREIRSRIARLADEIDVAHVHTCFSAFTDYSMGRLRSEGCPFVFTPHGKFSDQMLDRRYAVKRFWWQLWTKRHVQASDRLVVLSDSEGASNLSRLGLSAEDAMIPNGYDAADPAYAAGLDAESLVEQPYVLFLSYLDPRKQPELLVRAFARSSVSETHRLVIAGPDAYDHRSVIEQAIAEEQIGSRVTLYGPAYGEEKWALLSGATCFCLPSKGEGRPVTASEALGAGTPVVISRQSNFPEIAEEGAGIACDAFDVEAWSRALETVCHDEERHREMRRAAKRLAEDYTWSSVVDQWEEVYREVVAEQNLIDG